MKNIFFIALIFCLSVSLKSEILGKTQGKNIYLQNEKSDNYVWKNPFRKATSLHEFPAFFYKMDSVLDYFYSNCSKDRRIMRMVTDLDEDEFKKLAAFVVKLRSYPENLYFDYISLLNEPFDEMYRIEFEMQKNGQEYNVIRPIRPGAFLANIRDIMKKRLPWDWQFFYYNKFIVVVKVKDKVYKPLAPGDHQKAFFYTCQVLDDLRGNYYGDKERITLIGNFIKGQMEVNKKYLVLLLGEEARGREVIKGQYLIRGIVTDDYGFFPIENDEIIDDNGVLRMDTNRIKLSLFKNKIIRFCREIEETIK